MTRSRNVPPSGTVAGAFSVRKASTTSSNFPAQCR